MIVVRLAKCVKPANDRILNTLEPDSQILEGITEDFQDLLKSSERQGDKKIEIMCYVEQLPVTRYGIPFVVRRFTICTVTF